jgi:hypothetical protein
MKTKLGLLVLAMLSIAPLMFAQISPPENLRALTLKDKAMPNRAYPDLMVYMNDAKEYIATIEPTRRQRLDDLAGHIRGKIEKNEPVKLTFICTHNSRRSHMSQIWAAAAAYTRGLSGQLETFSGGTEATAFNPRAVAAIQRAGFRVKNPGGENPRYEVLFSDEWPALVCFSKKYNDATNPDSGFVAVMTCSDADENCPIIHGADFRVSLPYIDPKAMDNTPGETKAYDQRCRQIASEMIYLMDRVGKI